MGVNLIKRFIKSWSDFKGVLLQKLLNRVYVLCVRIAIPSNPGLKSCISEPIKGNYLQHQCRCVGFVIYPINQMLLSC